MGLAGMWEEQAEGTAGPGGSVERRAHRLGLRQHLQAQQVVTKYQD